jgi:hypothetical protein
MGNRVENSIRPDHQIGVKRDRLGVDRAKSVQWRTQSEGNLVTLNRDTGLRPVRVGLFCQWMIT